MMSFISFVMELYYRYVVDGLEMPDNQHAVKMAHK
jgi:hypothetical protein